MAKAPEKNKPDFRNGFPIRDLPDGCIGSAQSRRIDGCVFSRACSPSTRTEAGLRTGNRPDAFG